MTDRELLELAARAAGLVILRSRLDDPMMGDMLVQGSARNPHHENGPWNPLVDDGDALRLAVKFRIDLSLWINTVNVTAKTRIGAGRGIPLTGNYECPRNDHTEPRGSDEFAATRRAITRAAAEIGKGMQP